MTTISRLIGFAAALAVVAGGAAAIGGATDPSPPGGDDDAHAEGAGGHTVPRAAGDGTRAGVGGLTLRPVGGATKANWRFQITDRDGKPVREFEREQTKLLHLIVVRADLTGFQHLHPRLAADGTFSTPVDLAPGGRYRAITDFTTAGKRYVLGTTLGSAGETPERPLPPRNDVASSAGYSVRLKRPARLVAGRDTALTFEVSRGGKPVTDLQPYLGAHGHLVALRAGDQAYSHVHPLESDSARGSIRFNAELDQPGRYRLFLQFRTHGRVHTAAFSQAVEGTHDVHDD
jgi:hypothetical protein